MSIKTITTSTSKHLDIHYSSPPYISSSTPLAVGVGMVRYNTNSSSLEVYDGSSWINVESNTQINVNPRTNKALDWLVEHYENIQRLEKLAETNPTIADALAKYKQAEAQLQVLDILCKEGQ